MISHHKITPPLLSAILRYQMGLSKQWLLSIYRLDLDPHPRVHFAGPFGPGKMHSRGGVEVESINTKQTGHGHPHLAPWECTQIKGGWGVRSPPSKGVVISGPTWLGTMSRLQKSNYLFLAMAQM